MSTFCCVHSVVCCTLRSVGCSIRVFIAVSAAACCSRALCAGSKDLPQTCEYRNVFTCTCLPHRGQAVIQKPACLQGGRYSSPASVPPGVPAGVPASIYIDTLKRRAPVHLQRGRLGLLSAQLMYSGCRPKDRIASSDSVGVWVTTGRARSQHPWHKE